MAASRLGVVSAEEKQLLLERYLDIVWIDDVTEVKCVRCDRVPIQHYVSNCLHLYCRNCRTVFSDGGHWKCPKCREYVTELSDQHWELEDHIYQLRAHCPNKKYGCHYQGQLSAIPGHLRHCEETREAALPAEFKGITLETVVNQITILKNTFEEMRSEMKDIKDRCEGNCKRTEEIEKTLDGLMTNQLLKPDVNVPNEQLAHVEQLLTDVKELRDECEGNRENIKKTNDDFVKEIKLLRWDVHEHKEQLTIVKPVLRGVKELKEESEANWKHTETMVDGLTTNIEMLTQSLNEQKQQLATVEQNLQGMKENESSGAMEIGQLRTQLQQQQKQTTQDSNRLTTINANMGEMQSAMKDLKVVSFTCQTNWKDVKKHMDDLSKDLHGHKQQLAEVKDKTFKDALEFRQQFKQQQTLIDTNKTQMSSVESHFKGEMEERIAREKQTQLMMFKMNAVAMMTIGQSRMPHDELHSMTLLYQWHITDIKTKDGRWDDTRESEVFALTGYDCGATAILNRGVVYLQLINSKKTKTPFDTRSMPKLTWVIESQSTHAIRTRFIYFNESLDYGKDIYYCDISSFIRLPYIMSNGMKLSVYIEPPLMARSFFSNNGILLWRLDNYKERLQMERDGLIDWHESPYFYTNPHGYRVLIRLRLSETTVYGQLWFVRGEHDSSLTRLFPYRLTVTLFNHTDQSKNLVISQQGKEADHTYFNFVTASGSSFESEGYVADDSLLIKAVVGPLTSEVEPL